MKILSLYIMSFFYIAAGVMHFLKPKGYLKIMPGFLPFPLQLVYISGAVEILCGLLLLFPVTRSAGAWLTILLLIVILPANIQMAVNFYQKSNPYFWLTILRLPLQLVLIWWAWTYTKQ
ncbi:DoxX family protein [Dyadobacter psychrotolerans]|uniref:DoxX family protein n=1 Tax=Dyadobacter psychrotolerans TaxID=2541721 RepID=A0A4R5DUL8_9BACT|nr:DoxX family protein [Dyadobacter psychrotolerans]TDE18236.1 DoxX family protein [Dyadobacter psychrotolerans]